LTLSKRNLRSDQKKLQKESTSRDADQYKSVARSRRQHNHKTFRKQSTTRGAKNILEKTTKHTQKKQKLAKARETKENLQYLITMQRKPNRRSRRRHKAQTISKTPLLSSSAPKTRHTTPVVAKKHRAVDATG
jgi:hypothetical protein